MGFGARALGAKRHGGSHLGQFGPWRAPRALTVPDTQQADSSPAPAFLSSEPRAPHLSLPSFFPCPCLRTEILTSTGHWALRSRGAGLCGCRQGAVGTVPPGSSEAGWGGPAQPLPSVGACACAFMQSGGAAMSTRPAVWWLQPCVCGWGAPLGAAWPPTSLQASPYLAIALISYSKGLVISWPNDFSLCS